METRQLLAFLLTICGVLAHAQTPYADYRQFVEEGKTWKAQVGLIELNVYGNRIDGDTLIGGEKWKKVYNYIGSPDYSYSYYAAIRDVGRKVYAISKGSSRPRLLYDFGLNEGNTVRCGIEGNAFGCLLDKEEPSDTLLGFVFSACLRVERIDTIQRRGLPYRRFTLTLLNSFKERVVDNIIWVESVGSGAGPFSPWLPLPPPDTYLQSCHIGKNCIFGYPDFYEIDENDVTKGVSSKHFVENESNIIFDLLGRRLITPPSHGIYIRGGRKYVR